MDFLTEKELEIILEGARLEGVANDISEIPDRDIASLLQKEIDGKFIWQIKCSEKGKAKYHFKYHYKHVTHMEQVFGRAGFVKGKSKDDRTLFDFNVGGRNDGYSIRLMSSSKATAGGNKGNEFEEEVVSRLMGFQEVPYEYVTDQLVKQVMEAAELETITYAKMWGAATKRGDDFRQVDRNDKLYYEPKDIGFVIKDITVWGADKKGGLKSVYLSLKKGGRIKYMNMGLKWFFNGKDPSGKPPFMNIQDPVRGVYANYGADPSEYPHGDELLTMLGMPAGSKERELYFRVFNEYRHPGVNERYDIPLKCTSKLTKLIRACVGHGYIFVHQIDSNNLVVKRMDLNTLSKEYGQPANAVGHFYVGAAKQVEIDIYLDSGKAFKAVFRHTHGGVIPSIFMFDWYKKFSM